ncbi:pleiotropic drug resistance ABC transporter [Agrocybe pediades]|nr:pleiotropic drug resistance ABC transporter [Agrocybe pediades]
MDSLLGLQIDPERLIRDAIPTVFIALSILLDVCFAVSWPKPLNTVWKWCTSPFRNFLKLDDLLEPVDKNPLDSNSTNKRLRACALAGFVTWLGCVGFGVVVKNNTVVMVSLIHTLSWAFILARISTKPLVTPPYCYIAYTITSVLSSLFAILGNPPPSKGDLRAFVFHCACAIISATFAWLAGTLPLKSYRPGLNVAGPDDVPSIKLTCPEDNVNLWSWSTFTFVQPLLTLATKRTLNEGDVWSLSPFISHKNLFTKALEYRRKYPTHSLIRFLLVSNSLDLILDSALEMWSATIGFVSAYAMLQILTALKSDTPEAKSIAYFWTVVTFMLSLSFAQAELFQGWHNRRCYERTRGQLFCLIHYKSLKRQEISGRVQREGETGNADLGKIINLMQGDTYAVAQRFWDASGLATTPVRIVIALYFLYQLLGWSTFPGVLVIIIVLCLNYPMAQYEVSITRSLWKAKDRRLKTVDELFQNIRFLKYYGWENQWSNLAQKARNAELRWRIKGNFVDCAINFVWIWLPSATTLVSFVTYTMFAKEQLTVSKAFTSLALFGTLRSAMVMLPSQIFAMLHAYVSMQRIEDFLKEDEVPDWASTLSSQVVDAPSGRGDSLPEIGFKEATFEWKETAARDDAASARFELGPLDLVFPAGKLTVVSGPTGSGKSALLVALLGEIHCTSGRVLIDKTNHRVAYCAQSPWLEHATIRDNIIFGSPAPFDEARYQAVLDASALRQDLDMLPAGDATEIGEKGIALSGGQRARVALARAFYSQAKVILLDDPLAAVDMHTAQHLVNRCLSGDLARGRTIVLVTHHLTVCLPIAAYLVELDRGRISHQGSIPELEERGLLLKVIKATEEETEPPTQSPPKPVFLKLDDEDSTSLPADRQGDSGKLIEAEARAEGNVSLRSYWTYLCAASIPGWLLAVLVSLFVHLVDVGDQFFLAYWGETAEKDNRTSIVARVFRYPWEGLPSPNDDVKPWLMIYMSISIIEGLSILLFIIIGYYTNLRASRKMFSSLLQRLTRAPVRFFDVTPIGRILNRFTTDINTIDNTIQGSARMCLTQVLAFLVSFSVMLYEVPAFAPFALIIAGLYVRIAPAFIRASRDLRRLESVSLSPAFAGYDELLRGITHVRAFGMEDRYQNIFYGRVDKFQSFDHVYWLVSGWLRWRYDCLGSVVVFTATMFALWQGVSNGTAAVIIAQAADFSSSSRNLVRVAAQLELDFNSVERVVEYLDTPQEAPPVIEKSRPPAYWPSTSGELVVDNLTMQYSPGKPVLHNVSFTVKPGERIGIVGRTGSGKSSLVISLLRIVEPLAGRIIIDGIDVSTLGLEDLRSRITIVSQDVSLFSGSIKNNLDPLGKYTAEECMDVLDRCHLTSLLAHKPSKDEPTILERQITQGSMSAGEKQLLALARAMLRRTSIIILDEATSQIDTQLDAQIQRTIREEFAGAIVLTIAHRLNTIIDCDRVLVLDSGKVMEFDTLSTLLQKPHGMFHSLCRASADWPTISRLMNATNSSDSSATSEASEGSSKRSRSTETTL